jgi:hypothetical protein
MTNQHSIKPPQELLENLEQLWFQGGISVADLLTKSYQAGADQELEACCEWLNGGSKIDYDTAALLRAARRPEPPSLKEQALEALQNMDYMNQFPNEHDYNTIRRALETLPND